MSTKKKKKKNNQPNKQKNRTKTEYVTLSDAGFNKIP